MWVIIPSVLTMCNKRQSAAHPQTRVQRKSLSVQRVRLPRWGGKLVRAIAAWVLRLPVPQVAAHRGQVLFRTEPKFLFRKGRVGSQIWNVATPGWQRRRHYQLGLRNVQY